MRASRAASTGCRKGCPYCYAKKIARRFPKTFPRGFEPTYYPKRLGNPERSRKPCGIFVCSMGELFGEWLPVSWTMDVLETIQAAPWHRFYILTKSPDVAIRYSHVIHPWTWLGVTVTQMQDLSRVEILKECDAGLRFISFEPLAGSMAKGGKLEAVLDGIGWAIIGAQTNPKRLPKKEWVEEIIGACDDLGIPVFLKDNLGWSEARQEFPQQWKYRTCDKVGAGKERPCIK